MRSGEGPPVGDEGTVLDLIGNAGYLGTEWVVIPAERFDEALFQLSTRVAGDIVQKFVNYRVELVVLGDISRYRGHISALRDFVAECNAGGQMWFLADMEQLRHRLRG
ncbi:DUF4180 domain-containing protein [Lipingzhangella sp. LS1_29]|uniref:DUF4180 domain-containing protein n=2 Tax=Lipingzhangella rawalii TaxID=2055835 RepID=A0ABU2H794_9ACTN|nr:DUF4180 domain-containing protein [Lipingzhangella rawalii]